MDKRFTTNTLVINKLVDNKVHQERYLNQNLVGKYILDVSKKDKIHFAKSNTYAIYSMYDRYNRLVEYVVCYGKPIDESQY